MDGMSSAGNVVNFPGGKDFADRRRRLTVADVEEMLRGRWQDVVNEPIPGRWLQLLSAFERIEAERMAQQNSAAGPSGMPAGEPRNAGWRRRSAGSQRHPD